ncbi:MAG: ABC transporter ATP-binding protein [Actinomycetota bacterium]|nr:ABC transporter ATP-binding protein [Actinomycetota bacterium]
MPGEDAPAAGCHQLDVRSVEAGYGAVPIIMGVSLHVGEREIVTVVGPNGAGKSTLLKAIVGALKMTAGEVWFAGERVDHLPTQQLARIGIGYVPQSNDVFGPLSVKENLMLGGYLFKKNVVAERIREVYAAFPALGEIQGRQAGKLSGGERKMLAFGRALMLAPRLLILDEPTANLSPEVSQRVLERDVIGLAKGGVAILLVEQKARQAMAVSNRTYVIVGGTVHLEGQPDTLMSRPDFSEVMLGQVTSRGPARQAESGVD